MFFSASRSAKLREDAKIRTSAMDTNRCKKVTATSKAMVMKYGMSEKLGPRALGHDQGNPFLGRSFGAEADYSQEIAREIDDEIRRIIEDAHERARTLLMEHMESLHRLSKILLDRETIDRSQFLKLLDGVPEDEIWTAEVTQETVAEPPSADANAAPGRPRLPGFQLPAPPDAPPAGA